MCVLVSKFAFTNNATRTATTWDVDNFRKWCRMKMGDGETVYWYISGDLYEYPTGRLLAKVEGVDLARGMTETPDEAGDVTS
jgi:hypothetical protein